MFAQAHKPMKKIFSRNIPNHEATRKLAAELCDQYLRPAGHFTLLLEGGLGAGKTFLVKEILANLDVNDEVSSPTYALVNEYDTEHQKYAHWDFYRLEEPGDFFARGFQDLAGEEPTSHFVEWPERLTPEARNCFGGKQFVLKLQFGIGVGMRKVTLLQ